MRRPLPVIVVGRAAHAIEEAADWWAANRSKAPDAFPDKGMLPVTEGQLPCPFDISNVASETAPLHNLVQ
ncbi:MAG: hypothetical protein HY706_02950 [Candidatus Hydrogenedentes bacterium]|nr:hypothetical protein [Candidatus Hydrogenedentota bacterium]